MHWRLGIDLGTNSLGWWAFAVEKSGDRWRIAGSLDGGVYIFPDGREPAKAGRVGESRAVARRAARAIRRNRDRRKARLRALGRELLALGLLPEDKEERRNLFQSCKTDSDPEWNNPYRLRAEALERELAPHELGRVLFHLGLRRGFLSNRIQASDEDGGALRERIETLKEELSGRTLGQYLWARYREERSREGHDRQSAPIRFRGDAGIYPERAMYALEFDAIRARQAAHHALTPAHWERLRDRYVLFQWPLKPVERGACSFFPNEPRHWRDTPMGHDFRIYQELNSLRWIDRDLAEHPLNAEQRLAVLALLLTRKTEVKFSSIRNEKRADGRPLFADCRSFNLEAGKRTGLKPHPFAAAFSRHPSLAGLWEARSSDEGDGGRLDDIFIALLEEDQPEGLAGRLVAEFGLARDEIDALADLRLSRATANVSRAFMECIVPILRDQGLLYWEAVGEIPGEDGQPLHHSSRAGAGDRETLPYYGEILHGSLLGADPAADRVAAPERHFGRINNPTVHVALNALRRVLNSLILRLGSPPVEIHVELSRDLKKTKKERDEETVRQGRSERENERIRADLRLHGIPNPSALDVRKVKLWEELGENQLARRCPFSGRNISFAQLMNGEAEIEHILPFKRTLDSSMGNLTVALRWANRLKGNATPYEAFGTDLHVKEGIAWEEVRARGEALPPNKSWRFGPEAMQRFERDSDFIARQLTDNAYIAQAAVQYLGCLQGVEQIVPNRGGLTALLRGKWRLNGILSDDNRKSREDHRHHAVDAAVIALANRGTLASVSTLSARGADGLLHIEVPDLPPRIEAALRERVPSIVVACKPDHGWQAAMFKDTAYGFVAAEKRDPGLPEHNLVVRKAITALTPNEYRCIRDRQIRSDLLACIDSARERNEKPEKALAEFSRQRGIGNVRVLVKDQTVKPTRSAPYKGYKADSYVCCDVWRCPSGKPGRWRPGEYQWSGVFWTYADTPDGVPPPESRRPHPSAKHVTRLYKDDMVAYADAGAWQVMRVGGFSTTNNKLDLRPHNLADSDRTYISINVLGSRDLRRLRVEPDGRVRGLPARTSR